MAHDYLGNPVAVEHPATLTAIDDFIGGFLSYETRAADILAAADADPGNRLANAYAGFLWMFLEASDAPQRATGYLLASERPGSAIPQRERLTSALLRAWVEDDIAKALKLSEQLLDEFPRDLFALKLNQYFEFNRGNSPAMLRIALKAKTGAADVPHLHGMLAFAYEQCHLLDQAEGSARLALQLQRKEPWAQHALAHVLLTRGQIDEGSAFLEDASHTWDNLNSFMYTHNWWHLALFYLARGQDQRVLDIYDQHVWGIAKDYSQDQVGAVSLLTRLELAGVDVGPRWAQLAPYLRSRNTDVVQPFLSLQYLYGLARSQQSEAVELLDTLRTHARTAPPFTRDTWASITLPVAEGLVAYANGDHASAARQLQQGLPRLTEIGGSHAQRDLFNQIALDATLRSGQLAAAQQAFELRRQSDPFDVPANRSLARLYHELDLPEQALQAQTRLNQSLARR